MVKVLRLNLLKQIFLQKNEFARIIQSVSRSQERHVSTVLNPQGEYPPLEESNIPKLVDSESLKKDRDFVLTYEDLMRNLTQQSDDCRFLGEAKKRLADVLKHTMPFGKQSEGRGLIDAYKIIESPENLTQKNLNLAYVLSWCFGMQNATYIIADDILDGDSHRRGLPCWYKLENIGLTAINDCLLIESAIFAVLKTYLHDHHCYWPTIELLHRTRYKAALGESVDTMCKFNGKPRFDVFVMERIIYLAKHKHTSIFYDFPIQLAMYLANIYDPELHTRALSITEKIGLICMIHNDVQDTFGSVEVIGRKGTDISNGKCTWLAVQTLERGTPAQKQLFMEHYGKESDDSEQIIKNLYKELKLRDVYFEFERKMIQQIRKEMAHISHRIPEQVFHNFLADMTEYRKGYCYD